MSLQQVGSKVLFRIMCLNRNSKDENILTCLVPNLHHFVQEIDGLIDAGRPGNLLQYIERHGWFVVLKRPFNQHYIGSICNMILAVDFNKEVYSCIIHWNFKLSSRSIRIVVECSKRKLVIVTYWSQNHFAVAHTPFLRCFQISLIWGKITTFWQCLGLIMIFFIQYLANSKYFTNFPVFGMKMSKW